MEYLKVEWLHDHDQYPVLLYSELDKGRMEARKIEIYRNGEAGIADQNRATGDTQLSTEPLPAIEEIAGDPQFVPMRITQNEFETLWQQFAEH